jgi:hypothetical protein
MLLSIVLFVVGAFVGLFGLFLISLRKARLFTEKMTGERYYYFGSALLGAAFFLLGLAAGLGIK